MFRVTILAGEAPPQTLGWARTADLVIAGQPHRLHWVVLKRKGTTGDGLPSPRRSRPVVPSSDRPIVLSVKAPATQVQVNLALYRPSCKTL